MDFSNYTQADFEKDVAKINHFIMRYPNLLFKTFDLISQQRGISVVLLFAFLNYLQFFKLFGLSKASVAILEKIDKRIISKYLKENQNGLVVPQTKKTII